tara:strand:+ start:16 stop:720 length:705 start_codon:yes stop_codon:yes gene_type:complete
MKYVYTGPSWAKTSYPEGPNSTNLAKEWNIPYIDCARQASSVLDCVKLVQSTPYLPIVWIYNEPLLCLSEATGLSMEQIIGRSDWRDVWEDCNQFCLDKIASLNRPVLLIGGHSDIINCDHPNITIGHTSWQKFLAKEAGLTVENNAVHVKMEDGGDFTVRHCWGGEVIHKFMHEHPNISPSVEITNAVWDIFFLWKELEKANLFYEVHPNKQGTQIFAEFLSLTIAKFLQENQ